MNIQDLKLKVEVWPLEKIKPYPNNPKTHPPEQVSLLARLMAKYGVDQPIVVRLEDGFILKGHGRRLAAIAGSFPGFPVIEKSVPDDGDAKAQRIADNQISLLSGWDHDLLRTEATALKLAGYDTTLLAFPEATLGWMTGGDLVTSLDDEWGGMPHFNNQEAKAFRSIVVHFHDQAGIDKFSDAVGLKINDKCRFLWYPDIEIKRFTQCVGGGQDEPKVPDLRRKQGKVGKPVHDEGVRKNRRAVPGDRGGAGARKVRSGDRPRPTAGAR